ncbi:hypothetical protein FH972_025936 [Carpinus fangiana]|uniref:U3 small nucleolar RNA-associated protein 25 n=1 Tax=Carpinus fangiana TaxID=176857 RepID=A0A5N6L2U2_9ROSI|nr:hypothetical protein FH972_025936 [Carpinus fangiana]
MAPPAKKQKIEGAPRRALTRRAQDGGVRTKSEPSRRPVIDHTFSSDEEQDLPNDDSGSDTEAVALRPAASYNALLQSLGASHTTGKVQKKKKTKRRHETREDSPGDLDNDFEEDILPSEQQPEGEEQTAAGASEEDVIDPFAPVDEEDASDPFEILFANPEDNDLSQKLDALARDSWKKDEALSKALGRLSAMVPDTSSASSAYIHRGQMSLRDAHLKKRWIEPATRIQEDLSPLHNALTPIIFNYADVLFGGRTVENAAGLRQISCLHALNHIFKTRDKVLKNTAKLARDQNTGVEYRDQGFTRPKVLFLLETRQSCVRYMETITQLAEPEQQENRKRFQDTFVRPEDDFGEDRPDDFRELFSGNDDNDFRLGVKFTRKTLKFYSQFYSSDIIFASPLGLRRAMKLDDVKKADYDFLSSIELVIMDQADAMLMQNWDHVEHVFEHLNLQPKQPHGCDFSRVRKWYLDNQAKHLRQTLVFSAYLTPELNGIHSTHMRSIAGKVKLQQRHPGTPLASSTHPLRQTFTRFAARAPAADPDARFKHFTTALVPALTRPAQPGAPPVGALVFIPSYLDFVRVRNFFAGAPAAQHVSFGAVSEYTDVREVRRARSHFFDGRHAVLLYTGRAHHFRRYRIRGVRSVVMYGVPENPAFYSEIVAGFLGASINEGLVDAAEARARIMFSKWDGMALERIVGSDRVGRMLKDVEGDTFDFR